LERRLRTVTGQKVALEEERDEALEQLSNFERENGRSKVEAEAKYSSLQKSFDLLRGDFDAQVAAAQSAQQKLVEREAQVGQLEAQVVTLKANGGDGEVEVLKRQLSEQVIQIRKLEKTTRTQSAELTEFRKLHKSVEVVEEEKRGLEARLKMMETLREELSQAQLRVQILEEEKGSWASYLENEASDEQFKSPEDLARAFLQQRIENASLTEQLGAVQPELISKDGTIRELEEERSKLQGEVQQLKTAPVTGGGSDAKAKARVERQKILAIKETEYLRAQLKAMDDEEQEFHPERHSEEVSTKIRELQDLVDEHRAEVEKLHAELNAIEKQAPPPFSPTNTKKRTLEDDTPDERLGELLRKNRKLQEELSKYRTKTEVLEAEAKAQNKQLEGFRSDKSSRHRILELRNNPTSQVHAIKQSTLDALREENETLRAQLEGRLPTSTGSSRSKSDALIPKASLHSLQLALQEKDQTLASREKSAKRLRDIFAAKAHEFREAVFSLLGWKLEFMPNGRVKATSMFHPGNKGQGDEEDEGNFIIFDGENATMKVSGGVKSEFAKEIRGLVDFWVEGRGQVPCLLAAMTIEFFERYHD
jgi:chromosome segregation ATPase